MASKLLQRKSLKEYVLLRPMTPAGPHLALACPHSCSVVELIESQERETSAQFIIRTKVGTRYPILGQ